jgi:hypothetical protein
LREAVRIKVQKLITMLKLLGIMLGAAVVAWGLIRFVMGGSVAPLFISLAIIIAGPIEDLLTFWVKKHGRTEKKRSTLVQIVDLTTSIGFLICLGIASILA